MRIAWRRLCSACRRSLAGPPPVHRHPPARQPERNAAAAHVRHCHRPDRHA